MKNVFKLLCVLSLAVLVFAGCEKKANNNPNNSGETTTTAAKKGNCTVFECLDKIEATNTIEEINNIIGFEGKIKEESSAGSTSKWKLYSWELTTDTSVEAKLYDNSKTVYLEAKYPKDLIKNEQVDLSRAKELKEKINQAGGVKYDEFKSMLGGVDGVLVKKDSSSTTYMWVNMNGGNVTAHFNKDQKCTLYTALIK